MSNEEEARLAQEALDVMKLTSPGRAAVLGLWRSAPPKRQRKKEGNPSAT